jgi:type I restriction enzyme S subunit
MSELYKLPNGWEWKKFEELFTITSSKRVHKKDWLSDGIPFYRAREVVKLSQNGFVDNELFISEEMYNTFVEKYGVPQKDDILVTGVGTLGIPYVVKDNDRFYFKDGNIIWLKNDSNTNSKFMEYSFQSEFIKNQINSNSGSTVATYTITNANNTIIPLPPLSEQQRIVSKLDKLFEKIDKSIALHQKNIDEANLFMGSVLNDVFGELEEKYGKSDLKDIAIITMGQSPSSDTYNSNGDGIPFFQGKKEFGKLNPTVEKYCTEPKKVAKNGDILMSVRAPVGPTNIANLDCAIGRGLCSIRAKENQFTMYIYYFLNHFEKDIEKMGKGSTFSAINKSETETLKIPLPPLQIQQKVVKYLDEISEKIEKVKSVQKEKMDSLKALKASILDKAFRGEL